MSKRRRFILTSFLSALGFVGIQFLPDQFRFWAIALLGVITTLLFIWSLREGLGKDMTLSILILPLYFTAGVGLFWFLLPANIFTRIPIVIFYALGLYILGLTANIYTVAANRSIALLRAARGVGFVLTLVTSFLVFDAILSLKANLFITAGGAALLTFPLFFQGLWTSSLEKSLETGLLQTSLVASLIVGEVGIGLYFWPVTVVVGSLFMTTTAYILLGLAQARVEGRFFTQTVREYLLVGALVFVGMFIATRWGL